MENCANAILWLARLKRRYVDLWLLGLLKFKLNNFAAPGSLSRQKSTVLGGGGEL